RVRAAAPHPEARGVARAARRRAGARATARGAARAGAARPGGCRGAAGRAQAAPGEGEGRGAGAARQSEGRRRQGARHIARQGPGGVRGTAGAGAEGHRGGTREGHPGAARRDGGPLDRRGVEAARGAARQRGQPPPGDGIPGDARGATVKSVTIARNYAQALFLAAEAHGADTAERYGRLMEAVAGAVAADERIAMVLESPRVAKATKGQLLARALGGVAPAEFVRSLQAVVRRGRQGLLSEIALGRRVVLKVFPPELAAALSVDRFQREVRVAAGLQHPNIVPLLAAGSAGGVLYYTMPFVEGESLRSRLASEGVLPVAEAVRLFREVADALAHAHRQGVVHRDIKPDNVLL